ncbi:MAG: BamA/TamA family outer membrane protein [Bacteroidota bacterium]
MKWIFVFIAGLYCSIADGQKSYLIQYSPEQLSLKSLKLKTSFPNREAAIQYVGQLPRLLLAKGYLAASVDSARYDSAQAFVKIFTGPVYRWGNVSVPLAYQGIINKIQNGAPLKGSVIPGDQLAVWQQAILDYFSASGYPFASIGLDSVTLSGDSLFGKLSINPGSKYKIDSIHVIGIKLKPSFIYPYLHLKKGMLYQQALLDKIDQRIGELPFADASQPWQLDMLGSGSVVNIYLKQRRSNIINALIGLAPASTQTPGNKLLLSGEANILLRNAFNSGETMGINWQQIQYRSPRLNLLYQQPYLFNSQAGVDFAFELFKKDTQFVNINFRLGVPYDFTGSKTAKVFFQQLSTNVTYVDTHSIKANRRLPDLSNVSSSNLGIEYEWNTTDYRLNPRRGLELFFSGIAGLKKIKKNSSITALKDPLEPSYTYESLYDTVKLKTYQLRVKLKTATYIKTGRLTVLKLAVNAGWYQSQNYYRNELFQVGGSRLLRGFDEESIFARSYTVATAEYRFLTGRNSYFFAFSDGGYAGYKDQDLQYSHGYIGGGLGLAIETKNSMINLSWAVGKRDDLPFQIRQSKIHIGFVNYF